MIKINLLFIIDYLSLFAKLIVIMKEVWPASIIIQMYVCYYLLSKGFTKTERERIFINIGNLGEKKKYKYNVKTKKKYIII